MIENTELWKNGILPMLWGLQAMALYVGWLFFFYRRKEPIFSAWLGRCFNASLELNRMGYKATEGKSWLHRTGVAILANLLLLLLVMVPFFVLMVVWWKVAH
jgi:hypothetical protein